MYGMTNEIKFNECCLDDYGLNRYRKSSQEQIESIWGSYSKLTQLPLTEESENEEMKTEKIIDLWYKKCFKKIETHYKNSRAEIIENDEISKKLKETYEELKKYLEDYGYDEASIPFFKIGKLLTEESENKLKECDDKYNESKNNLSKLHTEVKTMASACETYEQEINVLKCYGVVDENGKLCENFKLK